MLFQAKKNQALILVYFLIFIQVIIIFSNLTQANIDQKNSQSLFNEAISQEIALNKIKTVEVLSSFNIKNCGDISQDSLTPQLTSRDYLVNCALKNLALGNNEEYSKQIILAKNLDPNWIGWK